MRLLRTHCRRLPRVRTLASAPKLAPYRFSPALSAATLFLSAAGVAAGVSSAAWFAWAIGPEYLDIFTPSDDDDDDDDDDDEKEKEKGKGGEDDDEVEDKDAKDSTSPDDASGEAESAPPGSIRVAALLAELQPTSSIAQLESLLEKIDADLNTPREHGEQRRLRSLRRFVLDELTLREAERGAPRRLT